MTNADNSTVAAPAANLAPWHTFAADYRTALASYEARITDDDKDGATHDQHKALYASLLAYPVATPHQLAEKAELILLDCWDDGAALGVIAADALIIAHSDRSRRAAWDTALSAYEAADAVLEAVTAAESGNGADTSDEWAGAYRVRSDALEALLSTHAPDGAAMGVKAQLVLRQEYEGFNDESTEDAATVSQWLASSSWSEHGFAAIYRDGVALSGGPRAIAEAAPDTFDAEAWLDEVEASTGSALLPSDEWGNVAFSGGDSGGADAAISGLRLAQQEAVRVFASNRSKGAVQ